jgi:hypothetical protein
MAKQEQKSDIYTKLISYPAPHDSTATATPQYKRILLSKSKPPYSAAEDKMSLFHAREYFCNALYAIDMWKVFFNDKRALFLASMKKEEEKVKAASEPRSTQANLNTVKLETLFNLVALALFTT